MGFFIPLSQGGGLPGLPVCGGSDPSRWGGAGEGLRQAALRVCLAPALALAQALGSFYASIGFVSPRAATELQQPVPARACASSR